MQIRRVLLLLFVLNSILGAKDLPTPKSHFGFVPGTDRELFTYEELIRYLKVVDDASDRVVLREIGRSPEGRTMYVCFISAPENLVRLDELRTINQQLAWNTNLDAARRTQYLKDGRVFVLGTLSMHSGEVGPSQAAPLIVYEAATTDDPARLAILAETVYMMVPNHNPDGMNMVVANYHKYKGTEFEGANLPGIYHKYVGHDNNRDFVTLSQTDTKAISTITSRDWMPQVMVEKHQMGSTAPRYFVPPMHDPIAENVDAELWNWTWIFGSEIVRDMTSQGLKGVSQHNRFDDYWPGSTETSSWKGVISLLTEAASARVASPLYVEPTELVGRGKGLSEYKISINMTDPWPGGWWRLSDIVAYEVASTWSILRTAAGHRRDLLAFRNDVSRRAVAQGQNQAPAYFIMSVSQQHDAGELAGIVNLLHEHGVKVHRLSTDLIIEDRTLQAGDVVVSLAQPYRAFIKEVMEAQRFPERHYTPGGKLIEPYDITSWSLPLHRGVTAWQVDRVNLTLDAACELIDSDVPFKLWDGLPP
ncbi:MAG: M14 family zinc carboxypeptidase, partial [Candidatus Neomarinimicrobiota bacterium]